MRDGGGVDVADAGAAVALTLGVTVLAPGHGELLLGGEDQAVAAGDGEVDDAEQKVDQGPVHARTVVLVEVQRDQRDQGDGAGDGGAVDADRAAVGPLDVGQVAAQHDERQALHEVGDHGAEHGHVEQRPYDLAGQGALALAELVDQHGQGVTHDRPRDQGDVGGVAGGMGDRQRLGEVAGPRQRVGVAAVGVDDGEEAGDQARQPDQGQQLGSRPLAEHGLEAVEQRGGGGADGGRAAVDAGVEQQDPEAGDDQGGQAPDGGPGDVALGVVRLLGGQR